MSSNGQMNPSNLLKSKMKRTETKVYVKWVVGDRASLNEFDKGKGIIGRSF